MANSLPRPLYKINRKKKTLASLVDTPKIATTILKGASENKFK